ncbi:MAG: 5-oxoprolinase subunit B family protein [Alphaproteobacteria bacterium]
MQISPLNENSIMVVFAPQASEPLTLHITQFNGAVRAHFSGVIVDTIPSYTTLFIRFNNLKIGLSEMIQGLEQLAKDFKPDVQAIHQGKLIEIPVYYGQEVALDANEVCTHTGLNFDEIIKLHTGQTYMVYAVGFSIGFAFLGQTDKKLTIPRKQSPRREVAAKSVALADNQTAVYPKISPGGWQIIGRTPIELIDFNLKELSVFNVGDKVRFSQISKQEFLAMGGVL